MALASMKHQIDEIPSRAKTKQLYDSYRPQYEMAQAKLSKKIRHLLAEHQLSATIRIRLKTFDSFFNKVLKFYNQGRREDLVIRDLIGIRVICSFLNDIEMAKNIIMDHFNVTEVETKSSRHSFREFGYDALHLQVQLPDNLITNTIPYTEPSCEVQLRTKLQDAWAEVEHEIIYKADHSLLNDTLKRKLASLNANLTLSDIIFQEIRDYQRARQQRDELRRKSIQTKVDEIQSQHSLTTFSEFQEPNLPVIDEQLENETLDNMLFKALDAHSKQNYDTALKYYTKILKKNPDPKVTSIICNHRGMVFFVLSNYEKAIRDFTRSIEANQENFRAYNNRGLAYRMIKKFDRAMEDFERSIEIRSLQTDAYFGRAQVYFELDDFAKALQDCDKVLNIKPDFRPAIRFKQLINAKLF
mgnify:CR=1 FL=1